MIDKIFQYISENEKTLFAMLSDMIQINTENDGKSGSEKALALYLRDKLAKLGISSDVYSPDEVEGIFEKEDYLPGRNLGGEPILPA